ncbi:MAG: c-type cytochrome [Burkholderiales bacterium]
MNQQSHYLIRLTATILALGCCMTTAHAASPVEGKSGAQVHKEVCMACHGTGLIGAPKFGDKAAWAPLLAEGQAVLTAHAWVGVRQMPPQGGDSNLTLNEFARATAFMARAAGGDWKDPDAKMLNQIRLEEQKRKAALKTVK